MNTQYTHGPWQVNGSHIYTADPERALLAQVFNPGTKASDYPLSENARLIAAAPDLLQALLNLVGTMCPADGSDMDDDLNAIDSCVGSARAAILKATGATHD